MEKKERSVEFVPQGKGGISLSAAAEQLAAAILKELRGSGA